ncbi:MAG: hypothetical protein ACTSUE_05525, partial [Promethearchaeota archaeon]
MTKRIQAEKRKQARRKRNSKANAQKQADEKESKECKYRVVYCTGYNYDWDMEKLDHLVST